MAVRTRLTANLALPAACFMGLSFSGQALGHGPEPVPQHPSVLPAADVAERTDALCRARPDVKQPSALREFMAQARQWAAAWDSAERPPGPRQKLAGCIEEPALAALVLATADDLTGAWSASAARCSEAMPRAPKGLCGELWRCKASASVHQGQLHKGAQELIAGLGVAPRNGELRLALAQLQLAQNLPHSAHDTLLALLAVDGGVDAAILERARFMADEAKRLAAPPLTPLDRVEQADLTTMMQSSRNDDDDVAHVRELAQSALQPQLWSACALVLLRGPDPALGLELLGRAERALPLDADPSRLLAVYYLSVVDYPAALTALLRAVRKQPFDPEGQIMLASVASRLGHWELTHSAYRTLSQLEPTKDSHRTGLAQARQKLKISVAPTRAPVVPKGP